MADFFSLDSANRVLEPEGKTREYKRYFSSPDGLTKSIVAIANSAGGQLDRVRFTVFVGSRAPEVMLDAVPRHQGQSRDHQVGSPSHQVESPSEQGVQLLTVLGVQDLSRSELPGALGLGNETRNVRRHLDPLLEAGLVERTIADLPRSSLQRYRITDLGRATLAQQEGTS